MIDFQNMKNCTNSCKIEKKKERLKRRSFATKGALSNIKDGLFDFVSNIALYELAKDIFSHISDKTSSVANLMNEDENQEQHRQGIFDDPQHEVEDCASDYETTDFEDHEVEDYVMEDCASDYETSDFDDLYDE